MHVAHGSDFFHHESKGHHTVGHGERVGVAQVDFVLAGGILVEAVLHRNAHGLQRANGFLAQCTGDIGGGEVEESTVVERNGSSTILAGREVEVLDVGRNIEDESLTPRSVQVATQHLPRVALERGAVQLCNIAEHPRLGGFGIHPWQYFERVGIGKGKHVGFLHAPVSING